MNLIVITFVTALRSPVFIRAKLTVVSDEMGMNFLAKSGDLGIIFLGMIVACLLGDLLPLPRF